jgi:O-antigen/teichoic acid export membrane protein
MGQGIFRAVVNRAIALGTLLLFSPGAFAYLDPSTGSMILSVLVGVFASIALAVKTYWYRIKGFFKRKDRPTADPANRSSTEE